MNTKLKCLLLDDELPGLMYLKMLCEQLPELDVVKAFNDPEKLLAEAPFLEYDLCISDIEMPGLDGLSLARLLKDKLVIFTTAYKDYAADAFDLDAVDYITKPVKIDRLQKAISKAMDRFKKIGVPLRFLSLNTDKGKTLLYFNQVTLIKTALNESRDKEVLLKDGSVLLLKNISFATLMNALPDMDFYRINKQEIVALTAVKFFTHNEITLNQQDEAHRPICLILTEKYKSGFLSRVRI